MNNAALQEMWTAILALLHLPDYQHREVRLYIYNYQSGNLFMKIKGQHIR
jgi:hypothetical protein